jgi:hypothetical protein
LRGLSGGGKGKGKGKPAAPAAPAQPAAPAEPEQVEQADARPRFLNPATGNMILDTAGNRRRVHTQQGLPGYFTASEMANLGFELNEDNETALADAFSDHFGFCVNNVTFDENGNVQVEWDLDGK